MDILNKVKLLKKEEKDRQPWIEKYRPKTIAEYVFQNEETKQLFSKFIENKSIPNLLLSGIQGTGKSSLAKVLITELSINKFDVMTINASSENGVDNVREKIQNFCLTSPMGDFKLVLLEEADGLSIPAQMALRAVVENNKHCRFILTCNYVHKIIPALHSRLQHVHIDSFNEDNIYELIIKILVAEEIGVTDPEIIKHHVQKYSPDLRKIINSIEQSSSSGMLRDVITSKTSDFEESWGEAWRKLPTKEHLLSLVGGVDNDNVDLTYRIMYNNVN